jgi:hypothetical protein
MKVKDLIKRLSKFDQNMEVMILDGFNAAGSPRDINFGPVIQTIGEQAAEDSADCEGRAGEKIVSMGYGCY